MLIYMITFFDKTFANHLNLHYLCIFIYYKLSLFLMKKYHSFYIILLLHLFIIACKPNERNEIKPPAQLIDRNKMIELLTEIQIADAAANRAGMSVESRKKQKDIYFKVVLDKYGVQAKTFYENYNYYIAQKIDTTIYQEVVVRLEKEAKTAVNKNLHTTPKPNNPANLVPNLKKEEINK